MTNQKFITEFVEILGGDNFFLCDLIDQDDLFAMQDGIALLIANSANKGVPIAKTMVSLLPNSFQTS
jgi:hypothetical protein|tara:strand:- start:434 stop:634 length:201 start_codon:yes stop_codon:yes gene_type:complete